jgi:8-amino-7-oxononanoate synthase
MIEYAAELGEAAPHHNDFTSSQYLGIRHSSDVLSPWKQLTTGTPAALRRVPGAQTVAATLADLQACDQVTLLPSTLHLFFDLFEVLRHKGISLFVDSRAYPIVRWGAERAAAQGVPFRLIRHYDPNATRRAIDASFEKGRRPVVVADGFCPDCGRSAPLEDYLRCVEQHDGYVVLDDTQALGIWGTDPSSREPYGIGGGGSLRLHAIRSPRLIVGASLAKAFGVPLAALAASNSFIRYFTHRSKTRVHTSPPSIVILRAAEHALLVNARHGDQIRRRLAHVVGYFRDSISDTGLLRTDGVFPVQIIGSHPGADAVKLHRVFRHAGIRTAVTQEPITGETKLPIVFCAWHTVADVDRLASILRDVI